VRDLNRETPHPTEPAAPCQVFRKMLVAVCPHCNGALIHKPAAGVPLDHFSRRTCHHCGNPYWLTTRTDGRPAKIKD
jgi:transposase-like protein